jgi:hypothetical protein
MALGCQDRFHQLTGERPDLLGLFDYRPWRFSVCALVSPRVRLSRRPLLFSEGHPALFNSPIRLDLTKRSTISESARWLTAVPCDAIEW